MQIEMWLSLTVCANNGLVSWPGHCRLWIRVLFSYTVWLLSVYLVSYCSNHLEASLGEYLVQRKSSIKVVIFFSSMLFLHSTLLNAGTALKLSSPPTFKITNQVSYSKTMTHAFPAHSVKSPFLVTLNLWPHVLFLIYTSTPCFISLLMQLRCAMLHYNWFFGNIFSICDPLPLLLGHRQKPDLQWAQPPFFPDDILLRISKAFAPPLSATQANLLWRWWSWAFKGPRLHKPLPRFQKECQQRVCMALCFCKFFKFEIF